jgi:hypothetical protein
MCAYIYTHTNTHTMSDQTGFWTKLKQLIKFTPFHLTVHSTHNSSMPAPFVMNA